MPDVKVPWEQEGQEFDAEKAKAYLTALQSDKEKLQERLNSATSGKKDTSKRVAELEKENTLLKVQMQTGLSDRHLKRLVGETEEELLEDAKAFAEETGLELRSFLDAGTTSGEEGDEDPNGEDPNTQQKTFSLDYRTPQNAGRASVQEPDYEAIVKGSTF